MGSISNWRRDKVRRVIKHRNGQKTLFMSLGDSGKVDVGSDYDVGDTVSYKIEVGNDFLILKSNEVNMREFKTDIDKLLFMDIATVRVHEDYDSVRDAWGEFSSEDDPKSHYTEDSNYIPEFSKVVCATLGYEYKSQLKTKSYQGDELDILTNLADDLEKFPKHKLCSYSTNYFLVPYLMKRYIINNINIPFKFDCAGKKPWDVTHIDLSNLWSGSGSLHTKFNVLCYAMGLEYCDMSIVPNLYFSGNHDEIKEMCELRINNIYEIAKRFK